MSLPQRGSDFSAKEWEKYSSELLHRTMPGEVKLLKKVSIEIAAHDEIVAEACSVTKTITVSRGRLLLLEDETEYAILLAHELGHIKNKHTSIVHYAYPTTLIDAYGSLALLFIWRIDQIFGRRPFSRTFKKYLFARETEQEIEADRFAVASLPPEMNVAGRWAERLLKHGERLGMWNDPTEPCAKMHLARIEALKNPPVNIGGFYIKVCWLSLRG